jgi:ABC-type uncharacterized transport system auxiliary subunit
MKKHAVLEIALLFALAGCFSSSPDKKYFQINLEAQPAAAPFSGSLLVDRFEINSLYDDFRIIYRVSAFEINYYAYQFWAEKPSKLLRDSLLRYLEASRLFPKIYVEPTKDAAVDWVFRGTVHQIEEVDAPGAWSARLNMKIEVADTRTGAVLASRRFDRQEPLSRKDVSEMPAVLSRILGEELRALFAELKGK